MSTTEELSQVQFSTLDFTIFAIMLGLSIAIGIYYGFCAGTKQNSTVQYLLGGKTLKIFPVAMSLVASHTSAIATLAVPADIYMFGATYIWLTASIILNGIICSYVYMPVFLKLEISTAYEYLKLRFDNRIRLLASFLYAVSTFIFNPIVIYVPALAFSQVTGMNLHLITPIVCAICIFYTTVGGVKAVVWTDTLQTLSIAISMAIVFVLGIISAGGIGMIIGKSREGHRLDIFDFQVDPTIRDSFWAFIIGGTVNWIGMYTIAQGTVQRFQSVPSLTHARKLVLISCIGIVLVKLISTFTGLIIYTKYSDCDPILTKKVARNDELVPYYVMDVAGNIPGLPGLFIAGVFAAGLSTLSTTLNTLSGIIYKDFILPFMPAETTQERASNILKIIVVISGIISTLLVFVVEKMGGVLPLILSFGGITAGPLVGLFSLGMLFPMANAKGALSGGITSLIFNSWMIFGNQYYKQRGVMEDFSKPLSVEGCTFATNLTTSLDSLPKELPFALYRISFWYYSFIGALVAIIVGVFVSLLTGKDELPVHPDLISPVAQFLLPKSSRSIRSDYYTVDKALKLVQLNAEK